MTKFTTAAGNYPSAATAPDEPSVTTHTHQTAPTQFVEAKGIRFAYRRFGKAGGVPLVFNMHFTGTMEPLGSAGDRRLRQGPRSHPVRQCRHLQQLRRGADFGRAYLKRLRRRTEGRDPEVNEKVAPAQVEALAKWGAPRANP